MTSPLKQFTTLHTMKTSKISSVLCNGRLTMFAEIRRDERGVPYTWFLPIRNNPGIEHLRVKLPADACGSYNWGGRNDETGEYFVAETQDGDIYQIHSNRIKAFIDAEIHLQEIEEFLNSKRADEDAATEYEVYSVEISKTKSDYDFSC